MATVEATLIAIPTMKRVEPEFPSEIDREEWEAEERVREFEFDPETDEDYPMSAISSQVAIQLTRKLIVQVDPFGLGTVLPETLINLGTSNRNVRPDVAFVSPNRWPINRPAPRAKAWPVIPELVVEVISPTDRAEEVLRKIDDYFKAGVQLVWVVWPDQELVYVYTSRTQIEILERERELTGGTVLPGFHVPLQEIFLREPEATIESPPA
jgi:Uma2 family endonuclease